MAGGHGGRRTGAGRKRKVVLPASDAAPRSAGLYADAEGYLEAVVQGREPADPSRIMAAKTLIAYQKAKTRAPVASLVPRQLARLNEASRDADDARDWERRAAEIRAKHRKGKQ